MENMMNKVFGLGLLAVSAMAAQPAQAEEYFEGVPLDISANAAWVSDYRFRGISQTDEKPALQLGADAVYSLEAVDLYIGAWGSNTDFNDGDEGRYEIDYYGGVAKEYEGVAFDVGMIFYTYPGARDSLNYDFHEYAASVGYDFNGLFTTLSFNYSPDNFASSGDALYSKLALEYAITPTFTLNSYLANQSVEDNATFGVDDYYDWGFGASYNYEDMFDIGLNYVDTNTSNADCADNCDGVIILSVAKSF
jgi:uncharacterized protein (TIGR02001 family)